MVFGRVAAEVDRHIRLVHIIVVKIVFDNIGFIAAADDKIIESIMRVNLHYMPEYGLASDLYHRLWLKLRLFRYTRTQSPASITTFMRAISFFDQALLPRGLFRSLARENDGARPKIVENRYKDDTDGLGENLVTPRSQQKKSIQDTDIEDETPLHSRRRKSSSASRGRQTWLRRKNSKPR